MKKRLLALLLSLLMLFSLLPTAAFAAVRDEDALSVAAPAAEEDNAASTAALAVVEDTPAVLAADLPETPDGNLCRPSDNVTVAATSSSNETTSLTPDKVIDGDTTTKASRWSSANNTNTQTLTINLGTLRTVGIVRLFWERTNVTAYTIQLSTDNTAWTTVYTRTTRIAQTAEEITFTPTAAQYIKIEITGHDDQGASTYNNVSLYEVEAYRDENAVPQTPSSVLAKVVAVDGGPLVISGGKVVLSEAAQAVIPADYTVTFGANLEQVVGADGTIYTPIVDKVVEFDFTATNDEGESAVTPGDNPVRYTIPGAHSAEESTGNARPAVVPEIMEWFSDSNEKFRLTENSRIIHRYGAGGDYNEVANQLTADVKELFGIELKHVHTAQTYEQILNELKPGDIIIYNVLDNGIVSNRDMVNGFDNETYRMDVSDVVHGPDGSIVKTGVPHVTIYARGIDANGNGVDGSTGAYWATRTLLQGMLLNKDAEGNYFPYGVMRDYPEFRLRGAILDVGRKPVSMDMLQEIVKNMAWYKMNDFHIHVNDNLIFLEDYIPGWRGGQPTAAADYAKANVAYSAFRLESSVQEEEDGIPLTAQDYAYTKAEFRDLVKESALIGVNIVPEIDAPAHAKAITDAFPSLRLFNPNGMNSHPYNDHLNLGDATYERSLEVIESIFDEYLEDDDPVFGNIVHLGADEYYDDHAAYRRFVKDMVDYLKEQGRTPRVWGSLKSMSSNPTKYPASDIVSEGVQMNIWSLGWADPAESFNMGFDLINCLDGPNYMVPHSGYYHPNGLGTAAFSWDPNNFGGTWIPASSSQMLGGAFALWNDSIDTHANGVDEQDLFQLFAEPIPYYATSLWGHNGMTLDQVQETVATVGYAPQSNPTYEIEMKEGSSQYFRYSFNDVDDSSGNGHDLTLHNAIVQGGVLSLSGGSSYAETGLDRLPWGSKLTFKAKKLEGGGSEQIIFAGDHAYGTFTVKALPVSGDNAHWKLGFSRELYDFVYEDVLLPVGEWVTLTLVNNRRDTVLYVDNGDTAHKATGYFLPDENSNTQFRGSSFVSGSSTTGGTGGSSFNIPIARIGSKANAFKGLLDDISATPASSVSSAVEPDKYDIKPSENGYTASAVTTIDSDPPSNVYDGNPDTFYHSRYSGSPTFNSLPADQRWFQIELAEPATVAGLRYLPRQNSANGRIKGYKIEVSADGETFTPVLTGGTWADDTTWKTARFEPQENTKYIRLFGLNTNADANGAHLTIAELRILRPVYWGTDGVATANLDEISYPLVNGVAEPEPLVTFDGALLEKDKDYTLSYQNNTTTGTGTVTVTGAGGYVGTLSATFTVTAEVAPIDLSTATVTFAQPSYPLVDGKAEPEPKVVVNGVTLLDGLDYDVTYTNNTRVGTATATITGIGAYTGTTSATFTVTAAVAKKNLNDSSRTKVTLHQLDFIYTGSPITPEPVVTYDGEILVKDVHYTILRYSRNTAVGTATVTVKGIAPYCEGSASATFAIIKPATSNDLSDVHLTEVIFNPTEYEYTGKPITPTFTVLYNGVLLVEGVDYTVTLSKNVIVGNGLLVIRGIGNYYGSYSASFEIIPDKDGNTGAGSGSTGTGGGSSSGGGSTGGSSSGGSSSGGGSTSKTKGDGVTTTVKTDSSGAMSVQSNYDDGTTVSADIPVTGPVTAEVTVPPKKDSVTVTIPTREKPTAGHIVVIIHPDGTEEIVKTALPTEDGMEVTLSDSALVQVVDNTKTFIDVPSNNWANEAITFVAAREIFNGTGNNTFTPAGNMSRAMVCTVLANLAGVETKGGATWYDKALSWAQEEGVSDGTSPNAVVTREQLAVMLYRYAGSPAVTDEVPHRFRDRDSISDWAELAMTWAVENDLIRGRSNAGGLDLAPQDTASRAEVAAVFQRYVALLNK